MRTLRLAHRLRSFRFSHVPVRPPRFVPGIERLEDRTVPSTLTVTNLLDDGPGSLRDTIALAESADTIDFAKDVQGTITLTSGQLTLTKDLVIAGPGRDLLAVDGGGAACGVEACQRRIFDVSRGVNVAIAGLAITGGRVVSPVTTSEDVFVFGGGIYNAGTLSLSDCTLSGNLVQARASNATGRVITANAYGGALFNSGSGSVAVTRSTFANNAAVVQWSIDGFSRVESDGYGGAIDNAGTLALVDSSIGAYGQPNISNGYGGGLFNSGEAMVTGSTFFNNLNHNGGVGNVPGLTRYAHGGAIANRRGALTVLNSTITGNSSDSFVAGPGGLAVASGGGIHSLGEVALLSSTVARNTVTATGEGGASTSTWGGGVFIDPSSPHAAWLVNTIVADNSSTMLGPDAFGPFASLGHNLIGKTDGSTGWVASDLTGTITSPLDARLGTLDDRGGPTQTISLLPDSPALDAGDSAYATEWDQRGEGFPRISGDNIDIGAYENQWDATPGAITLPNLVVAGGIDSGALLFLQAPTRRTLFG